MLRRHFRAFSIRVGPLRDELQGPVLFIVNHSSWWDGLLLRHAAKTVSGKPTNLMMDNIQLDKYRFFRKLGAYPVDRSSKRGILAALEHTVSLLRQDGHVWLFPQGKITHQEERPLVFGGGAGYVLRKCPQAALVPVTIHYSTCGQKPEVSMWFGGAVRNSWDEWKRKEITDLLQGMLETQLNRHKDMAIEAGEAGMANNEWFESLFLRRSSTSDRFDDWREKLRQWKRYWDV
ncbi:lysophospholipid acyltransferase family protein [Paenibacillus sp. CAU 1782]